MTSLKCTLVAMGDLLMQMERESKSRR